MDRARAASCTPCVVDMISRQVQMHTVCSLVRVRHRVSGISMHDVVQNQNGGTEPIRSATYQVLVDGLS